MRSPRWRCSTGFTLVEIMVVILILGMISTGLYGLLNRTRESYDIQRLVLEMQENARVGLNTITEDFRHVSYGKDPTQPSIGYAGPDSAVFVADIRMEATGAEFISYYLSPDGDPDTPNPFDTVLMKTVIDSGGTILYSAPQAYGIALDGLNFRYFNGDGVELPNPVPHPELVGEISVTVKSMSAREIKDSGYEEMSLAATVYPRNLPLTPARARPSTPNCGPVGYPNCESVTQVWDTPTTNTDGTELDFREISHFSIYLGMNPDEMELYANLARTFNEFTIPNLDPGTTYYVAVTCQTYTGVESHQCLTSVQTGSTLIPNIPQNFNGVFFVGLDGVRLTWDAVTEFQSGDIITTTVTYRVYRDTNPGFTPDSGNLLGSIDVVTQFDDDAMDDCEQYYYKVTAVACDNESDPSVELPASVPAPPSCPDWISAYTTEEAGQVEVHWGPPTTRMDGTLLSSDEIGGFHVLYDTIPGAHSQVYDVPDGAATQAYVSGLEVCRDYYFNVRAYDVCPAIGETCENLEVQVETSQPCDPDIPVAPTGLSAVGGDGRIDLLWNANTVDCDLYGYKIYYGFEAGGPYDGTGAAEGASPIEVYSEQVTTGDNCSFTLTELPACQGYYLVVSAIDECFPANESPFSAEVAADTECSPCKLHASCVDWLARPTNYRSVYLEIYTDQLAGETLSELILSWTLTPNVRRVYLGRPMQLIWDYSGLAGEDGPIGEQPSGSTLNVDDTFVDGSTTEARGLPMRIIFSGDMRGDELTAQFISSGNTCGAVGTIMEGQIIEDMDDGTANGWEPISGTWSVINGELRQTDTAGAALAQSNSAIVTDFSYSCKVNVTAGRAAYLVYRLQDSNNYYLIGVRTLDDQIWVSRVLGGVHGTRYTANLPLSNNTWYNVTVRGVGTEVEVFVDCEHILTYDDPELWLTGKIGNRTYASQASFDDMRVVYWDGTGS